MKRNTSSAECYAELQARAARIVQLQSRLDAIAATLSICEYQDMGRTVIRELGTGRVRTALVLARGKPVRELKRVLKRWAAKGSK